MQVFGSPGRYYQGKDLVQRLDELSAYLGNKAALVTDQKVAGFLTSPVQTALAKRGATVSAYTFDGELTQDLVDQLATQVAKTAHDFVIAAGGGKGVDAGKAVAHKLGLPLMTLPTAASTDSPTSKNYVLYDENHRMTGVFHMDRNPDTVLVDTSILASAPPILLKYGIGDAIAKKFEARQCAWASGRNMFGERPTATALALANACYDTLRINAEAALQCAGSGDPNPAFEATVEATILMAGLGFESGGLSIAHALTRGLPFIPGLGAAPHGFLISYGLMVQLKLERNAAAEHVDLWNWLPRVGLPRSLQDLDVPDPEGLDLDLVAEKIAAAPHMANFERKISHAELITAMKNPAPNEA